MKLTHALQIGALVIILVLTYVSENVEARPSDFNTFLDVLDTGSECKSNKNKRQMCEYCAKKTKSPYTYPNCCLNRDDVPMYCNAILHFGLIIH